MKIEQKETLNQIISQLLNLRSNIEEREEIKPVESISDFYFTCGKLYAYTEKYAHELVKNHNISVDLIRSIINDLSKVHEISMGEEYEKNN